MTRARLVIASLALLLTAQAEPHEEQIRLYERLYAETENAALLWLIAEANAEAGRVDQAIAVLEEVAARDLGTLVTADSPLSRFAGIPRFDSIAARLEAQFRRAPVAQVVATIDTPGVVPEGIAADSSTGRLFVGDMAGKRIFVLVPGREARVFAHTADLRPIGLTVDRNRGLLWVAATTAFVSSEEPRNAILGIGLADGIVRHSFGSDELRSVNDLAVAPGGDLFVTDSLGGAVFRLQPETTGLQRLTAPASLGYPNGIAVSEDGRWLYVAQGVSLRRVDQETGELETIAQPGNLALLSIDGLYWHAGSLIAVQNRGGPGRILRLRLSSDGARITAFDILEAGHPLFDIPTTGGIAGDRFYVVANSQLDHLQDDGSIKADPPLKPVQILELPLSATAE
jgi:sugar lactone lactonase YvrE